MTLTIAFYSSNFKGNMSEKYFQKDESKYQTKYKRAQNAR